MFAVKVQYETDRFLVRELTLEDANDRYLSWLQDEVAKKFIVTAANCDELEKLKNYVCSKLDKKDCLFLGVFEKQSMTHIGNIKYEPIDLIEKSAVMGILIGDPSWRGKAVAREVILSSAQYLEEKLGVNEVILGVDGANFAAIRAYEKMGFREFSDENYPLKKDAKFMKLSLMKEESAENA